MDDVITLAAQCSTEFLYSTQAVSKTTPLYDRAERRRDPYSVTLKAAHRLPGRYAVESRSADQREPPGEVPRPLSLHGSRWLSGAAVFWVSHVCSHAFKVLPAWRSTPRTPVASVISFTEAWPWLPWRRLSAGRNRRATSVRVTPIACVVAQSRDTRLLKRSLPWISAGNRVKLRVQFWCSS